MKNTLTAAAAALSLTVGAGAAQAQVAPRVVYSPSQVQSGQWYIAPNGCSYSRTQAPGEPVQWILISNPHHIGGRNATRACPSLLRG